MMLPHELYKGQIVHILGVFQNPHVGEIIEHPSNGKKFQGYLRIKNPCFAGLKEMDVNEERKGSHKPKIERRMVVETVSGRFKAYQDYVDLYVPDHIAIEYRPLDEQGELYEKYQQAIGSLIVRPKKADLEIIK